MGSGLFPYTSFIYLAVDLGYFGFSAKCFTLWILGGKREVSQPEKRQLDKQSIYG